MTWMKVDDRLHSHRKARIAGPAAMGLWVLAGSWAADTLTDGFVPRSQIFAWAGADALDLAERLVIAELWTPTVHLGEEGWLFHDWQEYQPTKAEVVARREVERDKKRRQRSCPPGTPPGSPPGSPGTGSSSGSKEIPYPDSLGVSPGDKIANPDWRTMPAYGQADPLRETPARAAARAAAERARRPRTPGRDAFAELRLVTTEHSTEETA